MPDANRKQGSVTDLIEGLRCGSDEATFGIWERYLEELTSFVCYRLRTATKRVSDEEDVVAITFESFFRSLKSGKYPNLENRDELWLLLVTIADRKAVDQIRRHNRQKRGEGVRGDSAFINHNNGDLRGGFDSFAGIEPSPEIVVSVEEEMRGLMDLLKNAEKRLAKGGLVKIVRFKFEGYTNSEIAEKLLCSVATIERRFRLVRKLWAESSANDG